MENVLVFGHKNPDTDTICSSLAYAMYKQEIGEKVEAVRLGEINNETKYVFDYLGIKAPKMIESVSDNRPVIMIDHNEFNQSVDNIENAQILEVIDHHRVDNFHTSQPLMMNLQPLGCSATIIYNMMKASGFVPNKVIATLLCSAIVSDSLLFQSPTCTLVDQEVCLELASIAGLDVNEYGMAMLKAGTDLSMYSASELIGIDSKTFDTQDGQINVSQVNTVSVDEVLQNKDEIIAALNAKKADEGLSQCILLITDIIKADSTALIVGNEDKFAKKFNTEVVDNQAFLPGVLSRKKQIVPFL